MCCFIFSAISCSRIYPQHLANFFSLKFHISKTLFGALENSLENKKFEKLKPHRRKWYIWNKRSSGENRGRTQLRNRRSARLSKKQRCTTHLIGKKLHNIVKINNFFFNYKSACLEKLHAPISNQIREMKRMKCKSGESHRKARHRNRTSQKRT